MATSLNRVWHLSFKISYFCQLRIKTLGYRSDCCQVKSQHQQTDIEGALNKILKLSFMLNDQAEHNTGTLAVQNDNSNVLEGLCVTTKHVDQPAKSLDLYSIENLWKYLGQQGLFFFQASWWASLRQQAEKASPDLFITSYRLQLLLRESVDVPKLTLRYNLSSGSTKWAVQTE